MDSFLVRVYRHNEGNSHGITGTVEEITTSQNSTFRTLNELGEFFLSVAKANPSEYEAAK